ncbi:CHAT domain-containing protein, partial [candidate division KSB1 bacterium]|nr:CHAT domain-containing protein [candidate division KSB1 bacterium]
VERMALCYWDMGQFDQALGYYDNSIKVHEKLGDENRVARALYNSGIILKDLGAYPRALDYLERALAIREKLGDKKRIGDALNAMGLVYWKLGEHEIAFKTSQKVLELMNAIDNQKGIASALTNMGVVLENLNRLERASEYYQRSLDIFQKLNDQEGVVDALSNLASVHLFLRNYTKSEEYVRRALQGSREIPDKNAEVNNLINLGSVLNFQGKYHDAAVNYNTALDQARAMNSPAQIWQALLGLGDNFERKGEYDQALKYYSLALDEVEGIRSALQSGQYKASFFAEKLFAYEAVIHLLGELHQKEQTGGYDLQAFHYAEKAKARAFLDLLAEALANVRAGTDPGLLQKQETILREMTQAQQQLQLESSQTQVNENAVAELKARIDQLEEEYRSLRHEIDRKNPKYSELQYPQPGTLEQIQSDVLDENTGLFEYSLGDSSSSLWVITDDSHQFYSLPNRDALQEQIEIVRSGLLNPAQSSPEFFAEASYKLYELLVQPAENFIKKDVRLVIVPDGVLNYLPFEILLTDKISGEAAAYSELPYLIKSNPISYGQSASVLRNLRVEKKTGDKTRQKQLLAFGDPVFGENEDPALKTQAGASTRGGLSRLPYSGMEIQNIAKLFPSAQADIFTRREASEEKVKEKAKLIGYKYVHFATHGLINERKPDFSSIVLAQDDDPGEDGFLQAAEIFNLEMNADLIVLSACQTGLGKMVRGEGIIGLTRAFMYAGASSVLVSLWSVSDVSTSKLMENFYENLVVKNQDKAEALRRAQLLMLETEQFSHPFYWAPFVLIGDWQ